MFAFDPTLRIGDIVQVIFLVASGFVAYYKLKEKITTLSLKHDAREEVVDMRLQRIEAQVEDAKHDLKNSQVQDLHIAQQRTEINRIWDLLEELRHWKGFVNPDGEYSRGQKIPFGPPRPDPPKV